jgi:glycosyltransferase involved in cell wall biosynthesis
VRYIDSTLKSVICAKEYYEKFGKSLKIVVSNNASTDGSREIIERFASDNLDIQARNTDTILSGDEHFSQLIKSCQTEYLCFVGGHDLVSHTYFYELEKTLRNDYRAPLCFSKEYVDLAGLGQEVFEVDFKYRFSPNPHIRFWQSLFYLSNATCFQGVIRTDFMKEIGISDAKVSDLVWLHGLLKHGPIIYNLRASYIRTNPIRSLNSHRSKDVKLKSSKVPMYSSLLRVWKPIRVSGLSGLLAQLVIELKFNQNKYGILLFRFLRRVSRLKIPAASQSRVILDQSFAINQIIRDDFSRA